MYVCMYVCMYACIHVCMHVYMYVCMYTCMYVCMCEVGWADGRAPRCTSSGLFTGQRCLRGAVDHLARVALGAHHTSNGHNAIAATALSGAAAAVAIETKHCFTTRSTHANGTSGIGRKHVCDVRILGPDLVASKRNNWFGPSIISTHKQDEEAHSRS